MCVAVASSNYRTAQDSLHLGFHAVADEFDARKRIPFLYCLFLLSLVLQGSFLIFVHVLVVGDSRSRSPD